ncbi:hypothetical protein R1sor_005771 [Riccia sorocarpa]|uniref:Trafficking protein particle complex subunit 8 n=1 Tax=Riccia sorocarpa TaxID=122646 RepID=A0ABD3HPW4_9MARC
MEGVGFTLAQSLRQQLAPVVMVLATDKVEASCQKNSLTFVDLLRPFCSLANVNVPVRTASEQPYRLQEFYIRMFYASEICQPREEAAEEYLLEVVNSTIEKLPGEPEEDAQRKNDFWAALAAADARTPSFQKYSNEFMRTLAFSEHEAVDHPVASIQAVSSRDDHPVSRFAELYNAENLPPLIEEGAMDPKLLKLYVLVHDLQEGSVDRANEILLEMRSTFGVNNCRILCINSGSLEADDGSPNSSEDIWSSGSLRPVTPLNVSGVDKLDKDSSRPRRGRFITQADVEELTDFVLDIAVKHILPTMELKVRTLYQQVAATRKGLKNQIKNLWWRKGKDEVPDVANGPQYTYNSIESQIRVLGDYAFMLRDYELALSNYRLLSSDYKMDKAWKRYAGVQEMIGLSLFMLDQSRRESELCMDTAINYYHQKSGSSSAKYATRAALWLAEMHKARGQYREAAVVLFRSSTEEGSVRSALFLEQAAYCFLRIAPPMLRKYGFHLVLAGNQYSNYGQKKLAMFVYQCALRVFRDQGWNYISDHVHFHLGRLCQLLENNAFAVQFFKKVIASSHQSPTNQAKFLSEFLYVIEKSDRKGAVLDLDLPSVDLEHVYVHFEDQRTYASSAAASVPEEIWTSVEEGLVPAADKAVNWLDARTSNVKTTTMDYNVCVAGEDIGVDVEFSNPLQVALDISGVSLVCIFTAEGSAEESGQEKSEERMLDTSSSSDRVVQQDSQPGTPSAQGDIILSEEAFTLKAGESQVVRLRVRPSRAGHLNVLGVKWVLSKIAHGQRDFAVVGKKTKLRSNKRDEPPPHQRLKFQVLGHMPRLEVSLHEMPGRVNAGEVRRLVLELSNASAGALKSIKFKTDHPLFLLVGDSGDLDQEFPACLEVRTESSRTEDVAVVEEECAPSDSLFSFPEGTVLEGGSTVLWPLWLHARQAGTFTFNTVIYYEPDKLSSGLRYRTVRITHSLQVLPSLRVGIEITPSPLRLEQFLLRLDIENEHGAESFWLRQVSCAGNQWSLASLPPPIVENGDESEGADVRAAYLSASVCPSQLLPAGQNLSLFFKLLNISPGKLTAEGFTSNIRLGPAGSMEPLIDICKGPLLSFLLREKLHMKKPDFFSSSQEQVGGIAKVDNKRKTTNALPLEILHEAGRVDVMLISEQQDGMSTEKRTSSANDSSRIIVNDVCHCSVQGSEPVVWVLEGPRYVKHDFKEDPFCEVSFTLTISNRSNLDADVKVETFDLKSMPLPSSASNQEKRVGWFPLTSSPPPGVGESATGLTTTETVSSSAAAAAAVGTVSSEKVDVYGLSSCGPYMWCNLRSTKVSVAPGTSAEVPLCITIFAPGIYDISRYQVSWALQEKVIDLHGSHELKTSVTSPQKSSKSTEITYAAGFVPTSDKLGGISVASSRGSEGSARFGTEPGHPYLLTCVSGDDLISTRSR